MPRERSCEPTNGAPRRGGVLVASVLLVVGLVAGSAGAQDLDPELDAPKTEEERAQAAEALEATLALAPEAPPSPDDPFVAVVEAEALVAERALARLEVTARSDQANAAALEAAQQLLAAKAEEDAAIDVREAAIRELATERRRLSDLTVRAFVTGGTSDVEQYRALLEGDTSDPAAGRELLFSQVLEQQEEATEQAQRELREARAVLRDVREVVAVAEAEAGRRLALSAELNQRRSQAERAHVEAVAEAERAQVELRSAGSGAIEQVPQEVPIIGLPRLNASDLATWFEASAYTPKVTTPIEDYARWFIEEGRTEGIRGDIAFAQAILETGGFTNTDSVVANNFSGIGHYDNLALGWIFPSPRAGVRAQIQLLKSYAVAEPEYANELVDRRLRGPAGCCETWGDLTTVWATDPTYGPKVMLIYTAMVDHALDRRARGEGFDEPAVEPAE